MNCHVRESKKQSRVGDTGVKTSVYELPAEIWRSTGHFGGAVLAAFQKRRYEPREDVGAGQKRV